MTAAVKLADQPGQVDLRAGATRHQPDALLGLYQDEQGVCIQQVAQLVRHGGDLVG